MKEEIKSFIDKIKLCKNNINIYENDIENNFKEYYLNCLNIINDKCKIEENINFINIKENNIIICEYDINKEKLNEPIRILNYLNEEKKNEIEEDFNEEKINLRLETNKDEINKLYCDLYLNDKKIDFC